MCGITGIWDFKNKISEGTLEKMTDCLYLRGPDDSGIFVDPKNNIGFGHRRLSILDLSPAGHQPMANDDQTIWITFNGEVYNFAEIRKELEVKDYKFKSNSDTEIIIKSYQEWGIDCIQKFRGMFAFAIWDAKKEKLFLVRDRAGVKPLYYYFDGDRFLFSSELKAFHKHPEFKKEINFSALALFLQFGYILAPYTIFENTHKVRPGHYLEVDKNGDIKETKYWDIIDFYLAEKIDKSEEGIEKELEEILTESFQYRMVSDVPVGVFLSGGIDSSLVTALLQKNSKNPIKTFTIGFNEKEYNEAPYAKKIAEHLGTDHHEFYCTAKDALEIIPKLPEIYDEPFGDSSAIPTYLVSKFARERVTVALSADAGDELFCGYSLYELLSKYYFIVQKTPPFLLSFAYFALSTFSVNFVVKVYNLFSFVLPKYTNLENKINKFKNIIKRKDNKLSVIVKNGYSYWLPDEIKLFLKKEYVTLPTNFDEYEKVKSLNIKTQMQAVDFKTYLPDDILAKVDRATMAVSLEAREPLIDHKIAEFIARVPIDLKYKNGQSKYILRKILYRYVPKELVERPKQGFAIPMDKWLKNDLKYLLEKYLSEERLREQGIFDEMYIKESLSKYLSGKSDSAYKFWFLLVFQMWYEKYFERT
ncbi:MAG: asparagine synthase (glutamine-hydrolyzing) [Candidatus Pacebacteria bacterium]|nr:asparagine synthase (glutamine-hydrolyzing) [Candidatus Paceibacterota bacterium]